MPLKRAANALAELCEIAAAVITAAIFVVMLAQIWFRYVQGGSIMWSEEICTMGLVWVVFLGSVSLVRDQAHVRVPLVVDSMPLRLRQPLQALALVVTMAFLVFLAWLGFDAFSQDFHRTSPMLGISTRWIKLAIPFGAVLMAVLTLVAIAERLRPARSDTGAARPSSPTLSEK